MEFILPQQDVSNDRHCKEIITDLSSKDYNVWSRTFQLTPKIKLKMEGATRNTANKQDVELTRNWGWGVGAWFSSLIFGLDRTVRLSWRDIQTYKHGFNYL